MAATAYAAALYSGSRAARAGEYARHERDGRGFHYPDVPLRRHTAGGNRRGSLSRVHDRRASCPRSSTAACSACDGELPRHLDAAEVFLEWLRGDDRRGGGLEWGDGLPRAACAERATQFDGDHRDADCAAVRDRMADDQVPHHGHEPGTRIPELAEPSGDGGVRTRILLPRDDVVGVSGAGAER